MRIGLDKSGQKSDIYHTARQERIKPKGEIQMKNKKYYIAYGSNLSVEQMSDRCPDAKIAGQAVLTGWELLFRAAPPSHRTRRRTRRFWCGKSRKGTKKTSTL